MLRKLPPMLFMAFLLLPLISWLSGVQIGRPLEEYRKLADPPDRSAVFTAAGFLRFTEQLNAWQADHFATRSFWVRLRTQALFTLFEESDQVHVGHQNWLFYRSVLDREMPSLEAISPQTRAALVEKFARVTALMRKRGVELYVMPVTLAHDYYPEFLPSSAEHAKRFAFYSAFIRDLSARTEINLIDSRPVLERAKASGLKIFHQTDFHWTDAAAVLVFDVLLKRISEREHRLELASSWDYEVVTEENFSGGEARSLPLFHSPEETTLGVRFKGPNTKFAPLPNATMFELTGVATPGQAARLAPILIYGDSFFDAGIRAGFLNFFSAYARARIYHHDIVTSFRNRPAGTRSMLIEFIPVASFKIDQDLDALIAYFEGMDALEQIGGLLRSALSAPASEQAR